MVLVYHLKTGLYTSLELFFDQRQGVWIYEVKDLGVTDLADSSLDGVELVVLCDRGDHPRAFGVRAGDKISSDDSLLLHVFLVLCYETVGQGRVELPTPTLSG